MEGARPRLTLDKLSKNVQGVIYQYLEPKELVRVERVCKKVNAAASQDYLYMFLTRNTLTLSNYKYFMDTWR
jgi:predicted RNA-binding protein with EMAP domain